MTLVKVPLAGLILVIMIAVIAALIGPGLEHVSQNIAASSAHVAAIAQQAARMEEEISADAWYADSAHAAIKHGGEAVQRVQNCLSAKGAALRMWNPLSGRHASVCEIGKGQYGIEINEDNGDFVTAFLDKKAKCLQEVLDYLDHYGYLNQ